eukprot:ANDGO_07193.mRNA.1 arsenic (+3 oxidation state) methyltransferase
MVGPAGSVTGVDITVERLDVSRCHVDRFCQDVLQYPYVNLRFVQGFSEYVVPADVAGSSMDLVISNCVVILSQRKHLD